MVGRVVVVGLLAAGLLAAGVTVGWAARSEPPRPEPFARYVEHGFQQPDIDDLGPALHIQRYAGRVELNRGFRAARLVFAIYKGGKPVDLPDAEADLPTGADTSSTLRYAVQVIDLDFLHLGDAKKGHCRLRFAMRGPEGETIWAERDLPKEVIDLSHCSNVGFTERAGSDAEVPLFWLKQGGKVPGPRVASKDEVVEKWTKDGSVLIVSLQFGGPKKGKD